MTERPIILERWLDFALRLADVMEATPARKQRVKDEVTGFIRLYSYPGYIDYPLRGWDSSEGEFPPICDLASEHFIKYETWNQKKEEYTGRFYNQIMCCLRAGIDLAVPDMHGGGVVGFTVGHIRRMYNNEIPVWINEALELTGVEEDGEHVWL